MLRLNDVILIVSALFINLSILRGSAYCDIVTSDHDTHSTASSRRELLLLEKDNHQKKFELILGKDIYSPKQLRDVYEYFYHFDQFHSNKTIHEFVGMTINTKFHGYTYTDLLLHRYDNLTQLGISGGPQVDQEACLEQLHHLNERARMMSNYEKFQSKDINLYQLLDTFGRIPSGLLRGNDIWLGSYEECLRLRIIADEEQKKPTRYCIVSLKFKHWLSSERQFDREIRALRAGVCLPKVCDSQNFKNKYQLIEELMKFNERLIDQDQFKVTSLYCLPDEKSQLADWRQNRETVLFVLFLLAWLTLLMFSTLRSLYLSKSSAGIFESLSMINNFKELFKNVKANDGSQTETEAEAEAFHDDEIVAKLKNKKQQIVDLSVIEGIKVLSMCYVITGHVLMCLSMVVQNGRDTSEMLSIPFVLSNMIPAFAVNSFFIITGLLTSYLSFKFNKTNKFILAPSKWLFAISNRYLRIMSTYFLVLTYTKTLAKFTSSGPLWDYATSALSQRRICEQESWLITLLFSANFHPPLKQCIPSAWYLANDFQFMLITPVVLALLYLYPKFGILLMKFGILLSFACNFSSILKSDIHDIRPVGKFMPHGFKLYVTFLNTNYISFECRILTYLCGLLIGYRLFQYEEKRISYIRMKKVKSIDKENILNDLENKNPSSKKKRPSFLINNCTLLCSSSLLLIILSPYAFRKLIITKQSAKLVAAFIIPLYHATFSLTIGLYIYCAATGYGNRTLNRILSAEIWKPPSRLGLSVLLINIEVFNYILQSSTQLWNLNGFTHFWLIVICVSLTYFIASIVYILFEAPIREALIKRLLLNCITKTRKDINIKPKTE